MACFWAYTNKNLKIIKQPILVNAKNSKLSIYNSDQLHTTRGMCINNPRYSDLKNKKSVTKNTFRPECRIRNQCYKTANQHRGNKLLNITWKDGWTCLFIITETHSQFVIVQCRCNFRQFHIFFYLFTTTIALIYLTGSSNWVIT